MKKLLFALLMFLGVAAFAPKADAGQYVKYWNGRNYTYVHKSQVYSNWPYSHSGTYKKHSKYKYKNHRYHRPSRSYYYSQPQRYYRSNRYYHHRPVRYYQSSRPRFAISFGF